MVIAWRRARSLREKAATKAQRRSLSVRLAQTLAKTAGSLPSTRRPWPANDLFFRNVKMADISPQKGIIISQGPLFSLITTLSPSSGVSTRVRHGRRPGVPHVLLFLYARDVSRPSLALHPPSPTSSLDFTPQKPLPLQSTCCFFLGSRLPTTYGTGGAARGRGRVELHLLVLDSESALAVRLGWPRPPLHFTRRACLFLAATSLPSFFVHSFSLSSSCRCERQRCC